MPRADRAGSKCDYGIVPGRCAAARGAFFSRAAYPRSDLSAGTKKLPPVASTPKKAYTIGPVRMAPMALRAGQRYA